MLCNSKPGKTCLPHFAWLEGRAKFNKWFYIQAIFNDFFNFQSQQAGINPATTNKASANS
jgi:hypothetical protein